MPSLAAVTLTLTLLVLALALTVLRSRNSGTVRALLLVGTTPLARQIAADITARHRRRYHLAGIVDDGAAADFEPPFDRLIVGRVDRLDEIIEAVRPDRIVIALGDRRGRLPMRVLLNARLQGIRVEDGVRFYERVSGKVAIEALNPDHLVSSSGFRQHDLDCAIRRALSLFVSTLALVVFAPLIALIAIAIKIDSGGPVLFVQDRIGLGGRRFALLKFRTMHPAWRTVSEWVSDNDGRITRVGRWLRRSRLDELPQLVNILRGDMNLVGPRPHPVCNFDLFLARIPYYPVRTTVLPGLTGWAQVRQGYANGLDEEIEKMRYDLYYIKHRSAWLDLRILLHTVLTVISDNAATVAVRPGAAPQPTYGPSPLQPGRGLSVRSILSRVP